MPRNRYIRLCNPDDDDDYVLVLPFRVACRVLNFHELGVPSSEIVSDVSGRYGVRLSRRALARIIDVFIERKGDYSFLDE